MNRSLILILVFMVLSALVAAEAIQLLDFGELVSALTLGEEVRVVAHYGECQLISGNDIKERAPDAVGGMVIDVFEYFAPQSIGNQEAFLVFSHSSLINYGGFIYNYVKFKVSEDNQVKITAQYANARDFNLEMDENFFSEINNGQNQGAIYFYK
ncbi:MAG: hypothetical protein JW784_01325 [Candidatus Cloacimonetes bacterium]|nr:hypothetical protein [Candidatus Cloacimonadota bacterium]